AVRRAALGIDSRQDDTTIELHSKLGCDRSTRQAFTGRQLMRTLEGGYSMPIGAQTEEAVTAELIVRAIVVSVYGRNGAEIRTRIRARKAEVVENVGLRWEDLREDIGRTAVQFAPDPCDKKT
ncbi:uncharacterized protein MYCGRDRAFT_47312, partial [Zymoseptoria tritici IPO323]